MIRICPTDVYARDPESKIVIRDETACTLCMECVGKAVPVDAKRSFPVKIEGDETSFIFYVESTGAIPPRRIATEAARIIDKKAVSLNDLVKKGLE